MWWQIIICGYFDEVPTDKKKDQLGKVFEKYPAKPHHPLPPKNPTNVQVC